MPMESNFALPEMRLIPILNLRHFDEIKFYIFTLITKPSNAENTGFGPFGIVNLQASSDVCTAVKMHFFIVVYLVEYSFLCTQHSIIIQLQIKYKYNTKPRYLSLYMHIHERDKMKMGCIN